MTERETYPQQIKATAIRTGDVLDMAVGPTVVLAVREERGGIACRVPRIYSRRDSAYLWFWPQQQVGLLGRDAEQVARWDLRREADKARREGLQNDPGLAVGRRSAVG